MKKIKIGVLTEIINYHSGARAPLEIAKQLSINGHNVYIFAYDELLNPTDMRDLIKHGVDIKLIKKRSVSILGKFTSAIPLIKIIKTIKPDVVWYSGTLPFFLVALITKTPIVRMYQGTQFDALLENKLPDEKLSLFDTILNIFGNIYIYINDFIAFRFSKSVVAISKYAAKEGENLYKRKCDAVIYHGTSMLPSIKSKPINKDNYLKLLSVSRITPYKGFHLIIEAINKLTSHRKIILTIVGSQPKKRYIEYLKKIAKNKLIIIPDASDDKLAELYRISDFYITADRYLYFGLPIYEAAYFGKPTISMNKAAASEIIDQGKTGFIAQTNHDLIKCIQKLADDQKLRKKLGINARKKAMRFTWEKCAQEWEKLILKTLRTK